GCKVVEGSVVVEIPLVPEEYYRTPYDPTKPEDTPKVTDHDKLGGEPVTAGGNLVIEDKTPDNHPESPVTINPDGTITVEEGTPRSEERRGEKECKIHAAPDHVGK